ncbi:MAG: endonuclease/exonuclease/phosphatase family protein [Candidatus Dependentiae bacterium]|nr:endonuclease/exonuclease/phosphatase family protein [Candidatus Dependentiae bacterium]
MMYNKVNHMILKTLLLVSCASGLYAMHPASMWQKLAQGQSMSRYELIESFINDCRMYANENKAIPRHETNNKTVRVATYNVHAWKDSHNNKNFDGMMRVIQDINADILVLQEVSVFNQSIMQKAFENLGYICNESLFAQAANHYGCPFGNMIVSKYPLVQEPVKKTFEADKKLIGERRCYVKTEIDLPHQKKVTIYGTHLDVYDETEKLRTKEIQELVDTIAQQSGPCIIAADCNAVRACDYQYTVGNNKCVWDLLNDMNKKRLRIDTPVQALKALESNYFKDCFTKNNQQGPKCTVWSGTVVDFMWLNKQWNLPIAGCYTYYSAASDHMPVIMDFNIV